MSPRDEVRPLKSMDDFHGQGRIPGFQGIAGQSAAEISKGETVNARRIPLGTIETSKRRPEGPVSEKTAST
jgi:hypothetical protein